MEISPNPKKELRSRIFRIATAVAFALAIGIFSLAPTRAADHGGGDHGGGDHGGGNRGGGDRGGGGDRRGGGDHGDGGHWGGGYYAPAPDYYAAPEPYAYVPAPAPCYAPGYEGPGYDDPYCSPPPPQGITLFFGL
jgi:hypothetical protein